MDAYIHAYRVTNVDMYIHVSRNMYTYIIYNRLFIASNICKWIPTYIYIYTYVGVFAGMHTSIHVYMHAYTHRHIMRTSGHKNEDGHASACFRCLFPNCTCCFYWFIL